MQLNSYHQLFTCLSSGCHGLPNRSCAFLTLRYLCLWVPENPHTSLPARGQTSPARCVTIQQQSASSILPHSCRRPLPSFFPWLSSLLQLAHLTLVFILSVHIVYYFLYFVEKVLEPQDPGGSCANNKFSEGLHIAPAAPPLRRTLEFLLSSCSFLCPASEPQCSLSGYLL